MLTRRVKIRNRAGIHCRPSGVILTAIMEEFSGTEFTIQAPSGETAVLDSIIALLALGLSCGQEALLTVRGGDESGALKRIGDLFEYEFDFPPRTT